MANKTKQRHWSISFKENSIMKPTALLLTENNENTIRDTLESLRGFSIKIGDINSKDDTLGICKFLPVEKLKFQNDFSKMRNKLICNGWNLHINPWEILIDNNSQLLEIAKNSQPKAYYCQVIEGKVITKEIRYWHSDLNLQFLNPVYETLECQRAEFIEDVIIYSAKRKPNEKMMELIARWKENSPAAIQPYYYEACTHLTHQRYEEFARTAKYYLLHNTDNTMSAIMLKYYLSIVDAHVFEKYDEIIPNLMHCIAANPLMAEFWCLLGDLNYKLHQYDKAANFYQNAIILGSRRLRNDWWPIELDKYKKHPERMIANCSQALTETKMLIAKTEHQVH